VRECGIFPALGQHIGGDAVCAGGFYIQQLAKRTIDVMTGTVLGIADSAEDGVALRKTVVCQD
jgi:hypothetical protein